MNNIDAIIFDLDNTLFDETDYFYHVVVSFCKKYNININKYDFYRFFKDTRNKTKNIINDILKFLSFDITEEKRDELFHLLKHIDVKMFLFKDAKLLLDCLLNKDIKLGLLTNGVIDIQKNKVRCLDIESVFDKIVYAREWGTLYEKPNEKPFRYIISKLGVKFKNCMFVGDNPKTDFKVPLEYGSTTVRLLRGTYENIEVDLQTDYIIKDYKELTKEIRKYE